MKKIAVSKYACLLILVFFVCHNLHAQKFVGDLILSSQAEVDAFAYSEIEGDLTISGADINDLSYLSILTSLFGLNINTNEILTNLEGLQNLTSIVGDLTIEDNPLLTNLNGLVNITSITEDILIENNTSLLDLDGLQKITSVDGNLYVLRNTILASLDGLLNITTVSKNLEIRSNDAITTLDGLQNISFVGGYLDISSNDLLTNLNGLLNIMIVEGRLEIYNNDALVNLLGLQNITSVGGDLKIQLNDGFTTLEGLHNIVFVGGYISVDNNDLLSNLDGLQNIVSVKEDLKITDNKALNSFCGLYGLLNSGGLEGLYTVSENAINPTQQQIIDGGSCTEETTTINSTIGMPTSNECGIWNVPVTIKNFNDVGAVSLKINYNETELTYSGVVLNSAFLAAVVNGETPGKFSLSFFGDEVTLEDNEVLFTLRFSVVPEIDGTSFNLNWSTVPGECEIAGPDGETVYLSKFINLSIDVITDELPEITCPGDIEVNNDEGESGAVVVLNLPYGTDNCPDPTIEQTGGLPSGSVFPVGLTTNIFKVADSQGNTAECSFTVTVNDSEVPGISNCPENILVETNDRLTCDQEVSWEIPTATDNCTLESFTCDFESGTTFPVGTTKVTYTAKDNASPANVSICSFDVTVVDNTLPVITVCAQAESAIVADGCSVEMPDFVSNVEASDNCGVVAITQFPEAGTWMEYIDVPYEITITVFDEAGNSKDCLTTFSVEKAELSGIMEYHNDARSPMNNITLLLTPGDKTCVTDENGNYVFSDLCAGTYSLSVSENNKPVGYINSTDAGLVNKWGTSGGEIEYVNFLAGDVSNDLYINSTDALRIQNYFVFGNPFDRNLWSYWSKEDQINSNAIPYALPSDHPTNITVVLSGADVDNYDLYALSTGDFNGSFIPDPLKSGSSSLSLNSEDVLHVIENQEFELSLKVGSSIEIGAASMILNIPSRFVEVLGVIINGSEIPVSWSVKDDELRIGWNSVFPVRVQENENLFTLILKPTDDFKFGKSFEIDLNHEGLNELADGNFEVINGAKLIVADVNNGLVGIEPELAKNELLFKNYPNPFDKTTTLQYTIPVDGRVNISVYNQLGQLVDIVVDAKQNVGQYLIKNYGNTLQPGIYYAKIKLSDQTRILTGVIKLNVLK